MPSRRRRARLPAQGEQLGPVPARPAFPYNAERPAFTGLSGAATATPFGCGLADIRYSYFSGERGRLACVSRGPDGRLRLIRLADRRMYSRVYDAAPADGGYVVVAQVLRAAGRARPDPVGRRRRAASVDLPYAPNGQPDQIVILPTGRLVVLGKTGAGLRMDGSGTQRRDLPAVSATPADHQFQCQLARLGDRRDPRPAHRRRLSPATIPTRTPSTGSTTMASGRPGDLGVQDMGAVLPMDAGSDPGLIAVLGGALHYRGAVGRPGRPSSVTTSPPKSSPAPTCGPPAAACPTPEPYMGLMLDGATDAGGGHDPDDRFDRGAARRRD
jgi:hypothetical protein